MALAQTSQSFGGFLGLGRKKNDTSKRLSRPDKITIRAMHKEGATITEIAEEIGFSRNTVSAFLTTEAEEAKQREDRAREADPLAYYQRQAINEVYGDPDVEAKLKMAMRRKILKGLDDNDLTGWQGTIAAVIREAAPHLGPLAPKIALAIGHDKLEMAEAIEERNRAIAERDRYIFDLEVRAGLRPPPEPEPKQLAAPKDDEGEPENDSHGETELADVPDFDPAIMERWIGMAPAVAAAEAAVYCDQTIPVLNRKVRDVLSDPLDKFLKLLGNPLIAGRIPPTVVPFLESPSGRDYWKQFSAAVARS